MAATEDESTPFVAHREEAEAIWFFGELDVVLAPGERTGGRVAMVEHTALRGMATPWHRQPNDDEAFYVIEGELALWTGDPGGRPAVAGPGSLAFVPRGVPHAFRVESERARWLTIGTPAGHERFYREGGEPARELAPPPPGTPDVARAEEAGRAHGVELLGPPPE